MKAPFVPITMFYVVAYGFFCGWCNLICFDKANKVIKKWMRGRVCVREGENNKKRIIALICDPFTIHFIHFFLSFPQKSSHASRPAIFTLTRRKVSTVCATKQVTSVYVKPKVGNILILIQMWYQSCVDFLRNIIKNSMN